MLVNVCLICFLLVRQTREAALDAQLLVVASDLGKEKASQMLADGTAFDTAMFTERLVGIHFIYCALTQMYLDEKFIS